MKVTKWKFIEHDSNEHADYYEREVVRDDGKVVVQIMCKGDGIPQKNGKVNNDTPRIHHQFFREEHLKVRPITDEEKARAVAMRGRGMGVEPSTVIVSLDYQHGFVASLSGDCDGGLGTVEKEAAK